MDAQLHDDLAYDFANRWRSDIPNPFFVALSDRLGEDFPARLVHPVGDGDDVAFLVVSDGGKACVVRFEPPWTTTFSFLGPLAGGKYTETVRFARSNASSWLRH